MTRTTLKGSYRAKQRRTQHYTLWNKLNKERQFSKTQGYAFALIVLVIIGGLGIFTLAQGELFHSKVSIPCQPRAFNLPKVECLSDPQTILWDVTNSSITNIDNNFKLRLASSTCSTSSCAINLASNISDYSIALTSSAFDLSPISGKMLQSFMAWILIPSGTPNTGSFGFFLTTNSTLPRWGNTHGGACCSSPFSDPNIFLLEAFSSSSTTGQLGTYTDRLWISRNETGGIKTLNDDCPSFSGQGTGSGICFVRNDQQNINPSVNVQTTNFILNYTGTANGGNCNASGLGPGCSGISFDGQLVSTKNLPWLKFQGIKFYVGYFITPQVGYQFQVATDNALNPGSGSMFMAAYTVPIQTVSIQPTFDTGGFFGPIIRAFIQIGVFVIQNLIIFLSFIYNILVPIIAGLASILGGFLITILNAFGNIFGDNHLGTDISTAFTQITNYFAQVFSSAVSIWGNILTTLLNFVIFITKFFVGNPFIAFIENFILQAPNIWVVLSGVWNDIMKYYISGVFTIQTILVFWYLFGMYEVYMRGTKGFRDWLDTSELAFFGIFKAGYWLIDEAYGFVVQLKQLLFGNTVSPVKVAGTG